MTQNPKVVSSVLLVKLDNGKVYQVLLMKEDIDLLLEFSASLNQGGLKLLDPPLEGIDF